MMRMITIIRKALLYARPRSAALLKKSIKQKASNKQ
jgi:hypothetical protein